MVKSKAQLLLFVITVLWTSYLIFKGLRTSCFAFFDSFITIFLLYADVIINWLEAEQ